MSPRAEGPGTTPGNEGRFEGYDVLSQKKYWDPATAGVVEARLTPPGRLAFFTESEAATAAALLDLLLGQHEEPKVPVLELVDQRLDAGETDGWRYEDLPEDSEAWRQSLAFLDEDAKEQLGQRFHLCSDDDLGRLLQGVKDSQTWHEWSAEHVWSLWTRYACSAFYAHPWAWNEVGFGGPAYPRGYKVLHPGWREPWERPETDAEDPVPWATRAEDAKRSHEVRMGERR